MAMGKPTDEEVKRLTESIERLHRGSKLTKTQVARLLVIIGQTETDARPETDPGFFLGEVDNSTTISQPTDSLAGSMPLLMDARQVGGECYPMTHDPRGKALIICNDTFNPDRRNLSRRDGAQEDVSKMQCRFQEKGFEPILEFNLTKKRILDKLCDVAGDEISNNNADCFVCVLLSHGDEHGIDAVDDKLKVQDLYEPFYASNCRSLAGKPKIFILQCCRGSKFCEGIDIDLNVHDAAPEFKEYQRRYPESEGQMRIPDHADFLVVYSSCAGYKSFRNTQSGSPFIVRLSEELESMSGTEDILTVLTRMNHKFYQYKPDPNTPEFVGKAQMPCFESTLTRKLKFPPVDT